MKNLRKLFAVTLLVLTLGLTAYADGQMETPKPTATTPQTQEATVVPPTGEPGSDDALTQSGQMETPKSAVISLIESILALI